MDFFSGKLPFEDCTYDVYDIFNELRDKHKEYANYNAERKILKVGNVSSEKGYILKISGEEMTKLYMTTSNINNKGY